jgi:predicted outer membrane repeat protein
MLSKKYFILVLLLCCVSVTSAAPLVLYNGSGSEIPLIYADTVFLSDYTKTLGGSIYGDVLEIGADTKIYGNVSVGSKCFLRERANISDTLATSFMFPCTKQNNVTIGKEIFKKIKYTKTEIADFSVGSQSIFVSIGSDESLLPGSYGNLKMDARSTVRLKSGSYLFSSIYTEPDVKWFFDLSDGPVKIYVLDGIRFADRNVFSIANGNPSEIEWHMLSGDLDIGTDGKFFGRFIAPNSRTRLAPRSHLVGGIEARHFQMEPQSTVSMEPRAEEISHSHYNFGPFYDKNIFRYRSALPLSTNFLEMYVYAKNFGVQVDGKSDHDVILEKISQTVSVNITRPLVSDFPNEAFSSRYIFVFNKTAQNRLYWNPSSPCSYGCDGLSEDKAVRQFSHAFELAQKNGLKIKMVGGVWEVTKEYSIFPVGLELIGNEKPFWELSSFSDIPILNAKNHPIEIAGKSPRLLTGLHVTGGVKGALVATTEKLEVTNSAFTNNASKKNGGSLNYGGKGLFVGKTILFENNKGNKGGAVFINGNAKIEDLVCSGNSATGEGGCLFVQDTLKLANAVFFGNKSNKDGGAVYAKNTSIWNITAVSNNSGGNNALAGLFGKVSNSIFWKNFNGNIPNSWSAEYSSFPSSRNGTGNILGDPKFLNESNPSGEAHFFGYDAGLILADKSPALKGSEADGVLEQDLIGTERGNKFAMGAYGDYNDGDKLYQYGEWAYGKFEPAVISQPLFPNFPSQVAMKNAGYGDYGRVIKRLVRKHSRTDRSKGMVRIIVLDSTFNQYPDIVPINVTFYRSAYEEDGKYVFETLKRHPLDPGYNPEEHGRVILFSKDPNDQGIHGNFLVIHMKSSSDNFRYEVLE